MGYKRERVYRLVFDDPELNGLEVKTRSMPIKRFLDLMALAETQTEKSSKESFEESIQLLAEVLISWNLEDSDGRPVEATLDGLYTLDFELVAQLLQAWQQSIATVTAPLAQKSSDGERSLEDSIPMEMS